jgi:hypothetical protein
VPFYFVPAWGLAISAQAAAAAAAAALNARHANNIIATAATATAAALGASFQPFTRLLSHTEPNLPHKLSCWYMIDVFTIRYHHWRRNGGDGGSGRDSRFDNQL